MTRTVIVFVMVAMGLVPSTPSHASCNAFPAASSASSRMEFNGSRGTLGSPFVIPTDTLRITRRPCDEPAGTPFPANADDVRTVVVLRPPSGKARAIVLKAGAVDGPCGSDAFTTNCQKELDKVSPGANAECLSVKNYTVQPSVVDLEFPDLHPGAMATRATSSRVAVAVLGKDDEATVCGQLIQSANNHCSDAIGAQPMLLACIDAIGVPTDPNKPCGGQASHPVFPEVTLLPVPNDVKQVCHKSIGGTFCDTQPVDELRYGLDQPGNVLLPMEWGRALADCPNQALRVHGEVRSPSTLRIPDNQPSLVRNKWLESYTFDGRLNVPPFGKETPSTTALNRFTGTTDDLLSVLRFGARYGECSSSSLGNELCNHADQCASSADTCDTRCVNDNAHCGPSQSCSGSGGPCGKLHDLGPEFSNGRWRLVRNRRGFCEDDPTTLCPPPAACQSGDCVSYLLTVGPCENREDGTPSPPAPQPAQANLPALFQPLLDALGIVQDSILLATAFSDDALALIVPRALLGPAASQCASLGLDNVLVAASVKDCSGKGCAFTCPPLGAGALVSRLKVYGTKVRFLQKREVAAEEPGSFDGVRRFFSRLFGMAQPQMTTPGTEELALLRILDTAGSIVSTVGEIVISDPNFDPFTVGPSGGTKLLAKVGRCITSAGKTLGIPSFCDPKNTGECPTWATCQAADVVMAMDLSLLP
jgi:hypothetical protein